MNVWGEKEERKRNKKKKKKEEKEKRKGGKKSENQREYRECELVVGESYRGGDATRHMGPISRKDHLLHPE